MSNGTFLMIGDTGININHITRVYFHEDDGSVTVCMVDGGTVDFVDQDAGAFLIWWTEQATVSTGGS